MIVMVVGNQHDINRRQVRQRQWRLKETLRANPRNGRRALVPHRVHEHAHTVNFDERGGMSHPCHAQTARGSALVRTRIRPKRTERLAREALFFVCQIKTQNFLSGSEQKATISPALSIIPRTVDNLFSLALAGMTGVVNRLDFGGGESAVKNVNFVTEIQ